MASTGSNLEAEIAGNIPEIKPIAAEITVPMTIFPIDNTKLNSPVIEDANSETRYTKTRPINPPMIARITASNRN